VTRVLVQSILDYRHAQLLTSEGGAFIADEPRDVGGDGLGPDPYKLLLWSLGACTAITLQMYARRRHIPLHEIAIEVEHQRAHKEDSEQNVEGGRAELETIYRRITLRGEGLTDEHRDALLRIAKRCPVHRTLSSQPEIIDDIDVVH
jgi:putative redox protein